MVVPSLGGVNNSVATDNQRSMASGSSVRKKGKSISGEVEKATVKVGSNRDSENTEPAKRRYSARIQKLQSEKASSINRIAESPNSQPEQCVRKKPKVYYRRKGNTGEGSEEVVAEAVSPIVSSSQAMDNDIAENGESKNLEIVGNVTVNDVTTANAVEKSAYAKVKETLRIFNKHYLHYVQVSKWKSIFFLMKCLSWIFPYCL